MVELHGNKMNRSPVSELQVTANRLSCKLLRRAGCTCTAGVQANTLAFLQCTVEEVENMFKVLASAYIVEAPAQQAINSKEINSAAVFRHTKTASLGNCSCTLSAATAAL